MQRVAIIAAAWLFAFAIYFGVTRNPEHVADDQSELLANCVAEQAYQNPMADKFQELQLALTICIERR